MRQQYGFANEQVIAIGDGSQDIPMLNEAGLGVAFNGKPILLAEADISIAGSLADLIPLLSKSGALLGFSLVGFELGVSA